MLNLYRFLAFLVVFVMLSGCSTYSTATTPTSMSIANLAQIPTHPTFTNRPLITPTATIKPPNTPKPSPTRTMTLTPFPSPNPEKAGEIVKTLLQKSMNCSSACIGGIIPNETTLSEARKILTGMGLNLTTITNNNKKFIYNALVKARRSNFSLTLSGHDETITNIGIGLASEQQQPNVAREWIAFSPETLVQKYGQPSKVDLVLSRGPSTAYIYMMIYFDAVNMIAQYNFDVRNTNTICPLIDQVYDIRVWIGDNPINPPSVGEPLEKTTSLSLDSFSKLMAEEPRKACFHIEPQAFP